MFASPSRTPANPRHESPCDLEAKATAPPSDGLFPATKWSLVARSLGKDEAIARRALGELLQAYWQPLYLFAMRSGLTREDAQDAVQGFCEDLIGRGSLAAVDRSLGLLRSFLLTSFKNHLMGAWRRRTATKRGGGAFHLPLEDTEALASAVGDEISPDEAFDRAWVRALLQSVMKTLRGEFAARGREEVFDHLEPFISWGEGEQSYSEVGAILGLSASAVQQAVQRLRRRYRTLLEQEIAETVDSPEAVESERLALLQILSGS